MKKVLNVFKPLGMTPYQLVLQFKENYPKYKDKKIGFAGRLDPMAEGVMILLLGDENKKRKEYEKYPKVYEFELLLGITSDTYDLMGVPLFEEKKMNEDEIKKYLKKRTGKQIQAYPPYSYPKVNGKPLYVWAREGRLDEIKIPEKEIEIYDFMFINRKQILSEDLLKVVDGRVSKVKGDFRQDEIKVAWKRLLSNNKKVFEILRFKIKCSSGTYIRSVCNDMGGLAYGIKRINVGSYDIRDSIVLT